MLPLHLRPGGSPLSILCLGAHCDDIEIGAGGTILRLLAEHPGSSVSWVVFASDAERAREGRDSAAAFLEQAATRSIDLQAFRESYFPYEGARIKDAFEELKPVKPDVVLTHTLRDRHQDHRLIAELTWNTFRDHLILEYEIPKYEGDLGAPNWFVPMSEAVARRKIDLILRHFPSQAKRSWFRADTFWAMLRLRGVECNAADGFAEAFHCRKLTI